MPRSLKKGPLWMTNLLSTTASCAHRPEERHFKILSQGSRRSMIVRPAVRPHIEPLPAY